MINVESLCNIQVRDQRKVEQKAPPSIESFDKHFCFFVDAPVFLQPNNNIISIIAIYCVNKLFSLPGIYQLAMLLLQSREKGISNTSIKCIKFQPTIISALNRYTKYIYIIYIYIIDILTISTLKSIKHFVLFYNTEMWEINEHHRKHLPFPAETN